MSSHITDKLNGYIGKDVTVKLFSGELFSGRLVKERNLSAGFIGFMLVLPNGIKVCLSSESIDIIREGAVI